MVWPPSTNVSCCILGGFRALNLMKLKLFTPRVPQYLYASLIFSALGSVYALYTVELKCKIREQGLEFDSCQGGCPLCCALTSGFLLMLVCVCVLL